MHLRRLVTIAALGVAASVVVGSATVTAGKSDPPEPILDTNLAGPAAVRALGDDLDAVAARYDKSPAELANLLRTDSTLWVDPTGMLHVKEPLPTEPAQGASAPERGPFPTSKTFNLHSRLGAERTIFLDFDGGPVSGTSWNDVYLVPTSSQPAFDLDGDPTTWSQAEHDVIQSVFQRVSEDFRPFNVDVTTQDPGAAALNRTNIFDTQFGTRVLITPSVDAATRICSNACGGVAYLSKFNVSGSSYWHPAWVFSHLLANADKYIAEAASHEAGHNLGLFHDGTSAVTYYGGQHNWAPIMGVGYWEPLVQWSSGEYTDANNAQDDIAVIQSFGLPLLPDDHGSTFGTATLMGRAQRASGLIERRTDVDVFKIRRTCSARTRISVKPFQTSPNLDVRVRLNNSAHALIVAKNPLSGEASADVATGLDASISRWLPAGIYYLQVEGVGALGPAAGYSDYGSLGRFLVEISACP